jgi:hypothetical protein
LGGGVGGHHGGLGGWSSSVAEHRRRDQAVGHYEQYSACRERSTGRLRCPHGCSYGGRSHPGHQRGVAEHGHAQRALGVQPSPQHRAGSGQDGAEDRGHRDAVRLWRPTGETSPDLDEVAEVRHRETGDSAEQGRVRPGQQSQVAEPGRRQGDAQRA